MSTLKEYVVCLNKDVDYDQFWDEIENESPDDGFVPSRRVDIVNERPGSLRSCHYALSEEEAEQLRNDPRIYCVELPPQHRDDIVLTPYAIQTGNFNKPPVDSVGEGNYLNWGLIRNNANSNVYGTSTDTTLPYEYKYNGTGVDVVISDSGLQTDHPEFKDSAGNTRVYKINWFTSSGVAGTQSPDHYRDYEGHGTHVAGIVAGRTYGWAKNSRIFSIKLAGLEGPGDSGTGIDILTSFDILKLWHRNKPIDAATGFRRPTVVNMSWGYSNPPNLILEATLGIFGEYRGVRWDSLTFDIDKGLPPLYYGTPARVDSVDVALQELIDEGVIVCVAAGNDNVKTDILGGLDYDNWYSHKIFFPAGVPYESTIRYYYHRGSSPYSEDAIKVGSIRNTPYSASLDRKSGFSNAGPATDIFAAGHNIYSTTSNITSTGIGAKTAQYYSNPAYKQAILSGTSMASPQVAGVIALYLQKNPSATPLQVKTWLLANATETLYTTGLDDDYDNDQSMFGGDALTLFTSTELTTGTDATIGTEPAGVAATSWKIRRLRHLRAYKRLARILGGI